MTGGYVPDPGAPVPSEILAEYGIDPPADPFAEHNAAQRAERAERGRAHGLTPEEVDVADMSGMGLREYAAYKGVSSVDDVQAALAAIERDRAAEAEVEREASLERARAARRAA